MAYDRLLERLYLVDDGWIVKGATALLVRDLGMRATIDVDLYARRRRKSPRQTFELRPAETLETGSGSRSVQREQWAKVSQELDFRSPHMSGPRPGAQFHVDLVGADLRMTGEPEPVPPLALIVMPDIEQHGYRAYPLPDHLADKVLATFQRYGPQQLPSTRYKDLVDLVGIVTGASLDAEAALRALTSEATRRRVQLPPAFDIPDRSLWEPGYSAQARHSLLPLAATLDDALAILRPCLDPLLDYSASGRWEPAKRL